MIEELNQQLKSMYLEPKTKLRVDVDYVVTRLKEMVRGSETMYSTNANNYILSIPTTFAAAIVIGFNFPSWAGETIEIFLTPQAIAGAAPMRTVEG